MNNENVYEHRLNVNSGAYPMKRSQQVKDVNNPGPTQSQMYNISSNYNIFPRKERDYDHAYIDRQRSSDIGADPRQPVSTSSNNILKYAHIEPSQQQQLQQLHKSQENYHSGPSRAIVRENVKIDPLTRLSQTFNNFANANEFITNDQTHVVPASVITPPEYPFTQPDEQPSNNPEQPPQVSRPPIDNETHEQPFSEPDYRVTLEKNMLGNQRMAISEKRRYIGNISPLKIS